MTALQATQSGPRLQRATLRTSRLLDFCSRKELIAQTEDGSNQTERVMTAAIDHAINSEKKQIIRIAGAIRRQRDPARLNRMKEKTSCP